MKKVRTCIDELNGHIQCFVVSLYTKLHPARVTQYFHFLVFYLSATLYTFDFYNPNSVEANFSFYNPYVCYRHHITLCHCKSVVINYQMYAPKCARVKLQQMHMSTKYDVKHRNNTQTSMTHNKFKIAKIQLF